MFEIEMAGIVIRIHDLYSYIKLFCKNFLVEGKPPFDMEIFVSEADILAEWKKIPHFSLEYCESIVVYRQICFKMPAFGAMLVHAAVISCDGEGFAFAAPSGTGKSTHVAMWKRAFGSSVEIINGDKPLISFNKEKDKFIAYGTPWCGKEGWGVNKGVALKAICFLEQGIDNHIRKAAPEEVLGRLFSQVLIPENDSLMQNELDIIDLLLTKVPFYILTCNVSEDAARVARAALQSSS